MSEAKSASDVREIDPARLGEVPSPELAASLFEEACKEHCVRFTALISNAIDVDDQMYRRTGTPQNMLTWD